MKHIVNRKNHLAIGAVLIFSVMLSLLLVLGMSNRALAAETTIGSDSRFQAKISESADGCKIIFEPVSSAEWVILHYGKDVNVQMEGSGTKWEYSIGSVASGSEIEVSFTCKPSDGGAYDSDKMTYTAGSALNTRVEAEDYTSMSGVVKESSGISGLNTNDWVRYQISADAGKYRIMVHAKVQTAGKIVFRVDNKRVADVTLMESSEYADYKTGEITLAGGDAQLTAIVLDAELSMDWFELQPVGGGSSGPSIPWLDDTENPDTELPTEVSQPVDDTTIPPKENRMIFQYNNLTNKFRDDEIYWCAIGYDPKTRDSEGNMDLCYVDAEGNLNKATEDLNTIKRGDRWCADIYNTLAENKYIYMPSIVSGRLFISYGSPVYLTINTAANGRTGFAAPDLNNPSDPSADVLFEFAEFTIGNGDAEPTHYWGNTTRVDNFCFPIVTRLIGKNGDTPYDKTVGDMGSRAALYKAFIDNAPDEFKSLAGKYRIIAPCKGDFNEGKTYANYFQDYIDAFWNKYSNEELHFKCEGGEFWCNISGDTMTFRAEGTKFSSGTVRKPNTQEVLEGKGAFNNGNATELVLEAQLCAAFNRGVALHPENWYDPSKYYQDPEAPYNYYSKFWHEHSVNGLAYGFCYDDVNDQSTLLECVTAEKLILDLRW